MTAVLLLHYISFVYFDLEQLLEEMTTHLKDSFPETERDTEIKNLEALEKPVTQKSKQYKENGLAGAVYAVDKR